MLSIQTSNLSDPRRQNSTPTVSNVISNVPLVPATYDQQTSIHRRGLSTERSIYIKPQLYTSMQDTGSSYTNTGPTEQHQLRVAQTQRQAQPGQIDDQRHQVATMTNAEDFLKDLFDTIDEADGVLREGLSGGAPVDIQRPQTPANQIGSGYCPLTPATTPFNWNGNGPREAHSRTAESSPVRRDRNATITAPRASSMRRGLSCEDPFASAKQAWGNPCLPTPPSTIPLPQRSTFDVRPIHRPDFTKAPGLNMDFLAHDSEYDSSHYSPMTNRVSPAMSSFQSSPELVHMDMFPELGTRPDFAATAQLSHPGGSGIALDLGAYPSPPKAHATARSQSIPDISLDMADATIEDTGISCDEIASFICGPDEENKWMCLYPECERRFSRKENIKSHVQTHLGDRQFRCIHCRKCFVRQHDLKRHVKIHSGDKPFVCACGNGFARQDALTRHRQRGVCVGAFEGTPRKEIKRGRPKKTSRPDTEERREKAAKTRQRVLEKKAYGSSSSASSEYSLPSPPELFDDVEMTGPSSFDDYQPMQATTFSAPSNVFSYTPPTSPGYSTGNRCSPQQSYQSYTPKAVSMSPSPKRRSITSILEGDESTLPIQPSPVRVAQSQYGTPPELDISSSPPVASNLFDFESAPETSDNTTQSTLPSESNTSSDNSGLGQWSSQDDEILFRVFTEAARKKPIVFLEEEEEEEEEPDHLLEMCSGGFDMGDAWPPEHFLDEPWL